MHTHSTKAERELNASLRAIMRVEPLPGKQRLYMLLSSDGKKLFGPSSRKSIDEWLDMQYPIDAN